MASWQEGRFAIKRIEKLGDVIVFVTDPRVNLESYAERTSRQCRWKNLRCAGSCKPGFRCRTVLDLGSKTLTCRCVKIGAAPPDSDTEDTSTGPRIKGPRPKSKRRRKTR